MKPMVDQNLCIGCGTCINACPQVFEINAEGKAEIRQDAPDCNEAGCCEVARDSCPVGAIALVEE